jgi:FdhD protein
MTETDAMHLTARIVREGREDRVALEEPLEIRIDGEPLAVTMRTPGHDEELALGFLYGEGLIDRPRRAGPSEDLAANIVEVEGPLLRDPGERRFYTTSSCGVCGKGALEEVAVQCPVVAPGPVVARELLAALPDRLRQPAFDLTGGVHATGCCRCATGSCASAGGCRSSSCRRPRSRARRCSSGSARRRRWRSRWPPTAA